CFCGSCAHTHLPSFPTRRSSDLVAAAPPAQEPPSSSVPARSSGWGSWIPGFSNGKNDTDGNPQYVTEADLLKVVAEFQRVAGKRSEEHTSELQSRVDLVCRLLLE